MFAPTYIECEIVSYAKSGQWKILNYQKQWRSLHEIDHFDPLAKMQDAKSILGE